MIEPQRHEVHEVNVLTKRLVFRLAQQVFFTASCFFVFFVVYLPAEDKPSISDNELAAVRAAEASRIQAIESVYGAVVAIYGNDRQGGGSGVLYDPAGYALTNHHVVGAGGSEGWAGIADGKLYRWKLIGTDPGGDVAIIQLQGRSDFPAAPLGDSDKVRVGNWAMAMGNPFTLAEDQRPTVTLGIVSGVNRFQEGQGLNQLVYGNCIQVDSSINPGNSGGPLFNLRGEVIGINGRGSFEERGRVNVGLGYAISSNQIQRFIPDLLATKITQHGTLDAVFGNRAAGVICHTLNLDSPIAKAGLELGDKLVALEGIAITDANQFTNLITTYPAGWPVSVTFERDGQQKTVHVRLLPLPYEPVAKPTAPSPDQPKEEKPPEDAPKIELKPPVLELPFGDAGKIRDPAINRQIAEQLLARWRRPTRQEAQAIAGLEIESDIWQNDDKVGTQKLALARDGRLRVEYEINGKRTVVACDGLKCWDDLPDREPREITRGKAILDPHFAQGIALAATISDRPLAGWGELALDSSDKADGRLCYRLSVTDASSEELFLWLTFSPNPAGPLELIKVGVGLDDHEPIPSTLLSDFQQIGSYEIPHRRVMVRGIAESEAFEIRTTSCQAASTFDEMIFALPQ